MICHGELRALARSLYTGRPLPGERLVVCANCGSAQVSPMPSANALAALYTDAYYDAFGAAMAGGGEEVPNYLRRRLSTLTKRMGRGRLLDLGSGFGLFVAYAQSQGWDAVGVDPSAWAAAEGRRRFGVEIHNAPLERAPLSSGSFDAIHANHVIEHLADPVAALQTAATLLRRDGVLVVEVPQELHLPLGEAVIGALRGERTEPAGPHHVVFFSARGLRLAAERAGFRVEQIENVRHRDGFRPRAFPFRLRRWLFFAAEARIGRAPSYVLTASRP